MSLDAVLSRRLVIISGKGGVGKTTIAAAVGVIAARHDLRVLVAEVEGKEALAGLFKVSELTSIPKQIRYNLFAMNISPEEALKEYFEVQFHMKRISRPLVSSQLVDYVTTSAPGLRDILMLGKVWYMATRKREFDLIVLDTPASGHAVSMLRSPEGFLSAVPIGPLANHARQVVTWLQDPRYVAVCLAGLAEEMPVNETIETVAALEEQIKMNVELVLTNMLYPAISDDPKVNKAIQALSSEEELETHGVSAPVAKTLMEARDFYMERRKVQQRHRKTLHDAVGHTARLIDIPFVFSNSFGDRELEQVAEEIEEQLS